MSVQDTDIVLTDTTANDVSVNAHGFCPKLPSNPDVFNMPFLRGDGIWTPTPDLWGYQIINEDHVTDLNTPISVGFNFIPAFHNIQYEFEVRLLVQTNSISNQPRIGIDWPSNLVDGAAKISVPLTKTTEKILNVTLGDTTLSAVGTFDAVNKSYLVVITGVVVVGENTPTNLDILFASEIAGDIVTIKKGSMLKYKKNY